MGRDELHTLSGREIFPLIAMYYIHPYAHWVCEFASTEFLNESCKSNGIVTRISADMYSFGQESIVLLLPQIMRYFSVTTVAATSPSSNQEPTDLIEFQQQIWELAASKLEDLKILLCDTIFQTHALADTNRPRKSRMSLPGRRDVFPLVPVGTLHIIRRPSWFKCNLIASGESSFSCRLLTAESREQRTWFLS